MTYQAREPVTHGERWQERCEEMYAREDRAISLRPLERNEVLLIEWFERERKADEWKRNQNTPSKEVTPGEPPASDTVPRAGLQT